MVYAGLGALAAAGLAGCDPRFVRHSDLRPAEIQALAGTWQGEGALSFSNASDCTRVYLWTLRVKDGNVDGEIVDRRTPYAPHARFTSFVDYDGSVHATLNAYGRDTEVLGTFGRDSFTGTARSKGCNYAVHLHYVAGTQ